jgi:adenosylcobinamide-phosphate synthase
MESQPFPWLAVLVAPAATPGDPLLVLLLALAVDAVAGEMAPLFRIVPHPVVALGRIIAWLDRRLNRPRRGTAARRRRGVLTLVLVAGGAAGLGVAVHHGAALLPHGWVVEVLLAASLIAQRSLHDHVRAVARGLRTEGLDGGRRAVARIVGRDPDRLDDAGVARAAIESCAENFSDGVVAPVVWYLIGGLPGLMAYKAVNTLDSMIGHRTPRHEAFGWASARFDDLLNLIPARLAGLLLAAAAGLTDPTAGRAALTAMWRDAGKHRSPNAGWPEAAMAGALGLRLAGPRAYAGYTVADPWIGPGTAAATAAHIDRALILLVRGCAVTGGAVAMLWILGRTLSPAA